MNAEPDHNASALSGFEQQYLLLRQKEGRIYSDDQARLLPALPKEHPLFNEWKVRKFSANNLSEYLEQKKRHLSILEIGCGNGWLSHCLSLLRNTSVVGMDINSVELQQAKRLFTKENLDFIAGDIRYDKPAQQFDVIVFAASLQYFKSLPEVIDVSFQLLNEEGEVHILDTHFYRRYELGTAIQRSSHYFREAGFPLMEPFYFHHCLADLDVYSFQVLYDPRSFINRILKPSPFPWLRIKKC